MRQLLRTQAHLGSCLEPQAVQTAEDRCNMPFKAHRNPVEQPGNQPEPAIKVPVPARPVYSTDNTIEFAPESALIASESNPPSIGIEVRNNARDKFVR